MGRKPKQILQEGSSDRAERVAAHVGFGKDIDAIARWVVERYSRDDAPGGGKRTDEWAMMAVKLPDSAKKKIEACDDEFLEAFDAYMLLYETSDYKTLMANLVAERHVLRQLMRTPPSSDEGGDVDWDRINKGFKTTCDLSKESVDMRRRNSAMEEALSATGRISEAALKRRTAKEVKIGAESLANGTGAR